MDQPCAGVKRRLLRIVGTALITAGLVILADAGLTLVWQEPASAAFAWFGQRDAEADLEELEAEFAKQSQTETNTERRGFAPLARRMEAEIRTGQGIGRVAIREIGLDVVMVQGTDTSSLRKGPGRYPATALPGQGRTIGIAGHRTTYSAPFRRINELDGGERLTVEMPYGRFTYEVKKTRIVEPTQVGVVRDVGRERVVLTACHPLYSAKQRIVVFASLIGEEPIATRAPAANPTEPGGMAQRESSV